MIWQYDGRMAIDEALARHERSLMSVPGVVGVGVADRSGRPVILVMLTHVTPEAKALPEQLDGYPISVEVTGEATAFSTDYRG